LYHPRAVRVLPAPWLFRRRNMAMTPENLEQLIHKIVADIGATEAAAFSVQPDFFEDHRIVPLVHMRPDSPDDAARQAAIAAFKEILTPCIQQANDGAIEIDGTADGETKQFCLVTLARRENEIVGAAMFIVRCRDLEHAHTVLRLVQRAAAGF
jgi:hypothetical protein